MADMIMTPFICGYLRVAGSPYMVIRIVVVG